MSADKSRLQRLSRKGFIHNAKGKGMKIDMMGNFANQIRFFTEQLVVRGTLTRLILVAIMLGIITLGGGLTVMWFDEELSNPFSALWWAFLRLTDPGYLGDDEGTIRRFISTVLTILGYVFFLGALVAILIQWLDATLKRLEQGYTPITLSGHFVVLGWTRRTPDLVSELINNKGRLNRFLRRRRIKRLRVVILCEEVSGAINRSLREHLRLSILDRRFILRSGTALKADHLHRVDFRRASVIILPSDDPGDAPLTSLAPDTRVLKTILTISREAGREGGGHPLPLLVAEMRDPRRAKLARNAYEGPLELIAGELVSARLIAQSLRHWGISHVYRELLDYSVGSFIYTREVPPALHGVSFGGASTSSGQIILLGVVRAGDGVYRFHANPPPEMKLEQGARIVYIANDYSEEELSRRKDGIAPPKGAGAHGAAGREDRAPAAPLRVLVLGWSRIVPRIVRELDDSGAGGISLAILSRVSIAEREEILARPHFHPGQVTITQHHGDVTVVGDIRGAAPADFDRILIVASDRLEAEEEADARSICAYMALEEALRGAKRKPGLLVELYEKENLGLLDGDWAQALVTPQILGHMLSQVALRRELNAVYEQLFLPGGNEFLFRNLPAEAPAGQTATFRDVAAAVRKTGGIPLGLRLHELRNTRPGGILINPGEEYVFTPSAHDQVVVLSTGVDDPSDS